MKKFLFGLILLLFTLQLDVYAEEKLTCKYKYNNGEFFNVEISLSYPDENGEVEVLKQVNNIAGISKIEVQFPDKIAELRVRNSEYKLSCPELYFNLNTVVNNRVTTTTLDVFFVDDSKKNQSSKEFPLIDSEIINNSEQNPEEEYEKKVLTTCVYNDPSGNKAFSMTIYTDKTIGSKSLYGSFSNYQINFNIETLDDCPEKVHRLCSSIGGNYCSIDLNHQYAQQTTLTLAGKESNSEGVDVTVVATYVASTNKNAPNIKIVKNETGTGYSAIQNNQSISINGLSNFDPNNKLRYIIEADNGDRQFSDKPDSSAKYNYIEKSYLNSLVLDGKAIEATCEDIIGGSGGFLEFLNNNVLKIIYIGVPILLIVLTSFDFAKVVFINDKEGIQNAGKRFGKRVIAAVLIYFVPTILIFLTGIIGTDKVSECAKILQEIASESK